MNNEPCPFCGSKQRRIERPEVDRHGQKIYDWCCHAMKTNAEFVANRYRDTRGRVPDVDEISKW